MDPEGLDRIFVPSQTPYMSDRVFTLLIERLRAIASRKQRFSYDVRGNSYVNSVLSGVLLPCAASARRANASVKSMRCRRSSVR